MRSRLSLRKQRCRGEVGSAIADFALVSIVLVPLFFGILQLALIWHVKTTLTSAASEGARYGAGYNRHVADGAARTSAVIDEVFGTDFADQVAASSTVVEGAFFRFRKSNGTSLLRRAGVLPPGGSCESGLARGHQSLENLPARSGQVCDPLLPRLPVRLRLRSHSGFRNR